MGRVGTRRALLGGAGGIAYLLRDLFSDDRAAGAVHGTPADPGPGTRTVVDTMGLLSIGYYNLYDQFTNVLAAGAVNGSGAQPGPGVRTVVDTENKVSVA